MENLMTLDNALMILPWVLWLGTLLLAVLKLRKQGKTWAEAFHVAINTLKVEDKMVDGTFSPDLVKKVGAVAEALQVGKEAKEKVEKVLSEGKELDIKVGSIKGKPIYLGDITGIGSTLAAALRRLKGIKL